MWKIYTKIGTLSKFSLLAFALFFSACSIKNYERTQSKIIIIKSPKIKFADVGYVRNSDKAVELELFLAGQAIEKISINHLVCVSDGCMSKSGFNADYLNASYPDEILQNILLGRSVYDGKNKTLTQNGFEQRIQNSKVDIRYVVDQNQIFFKDKKNSIIIKIKDVK